MPIYTVLNENGKPIKKNGYTKYRVIVSYVDNNGKYKKVERITYGSDNAKDVELELIKKINKKELETSISYKELKNQYLLSKKADTKPGTYRAIVGRLENHITPFFESYKINKINASLIQKWKNEINNKSIDLGTKKNAYGSLRALLNFAVKMEYISKNPIRSIDNFKDPNYIKKEMDYYTVEEFKKFIAIAKDEAIRMEEKTNSIYEWHYYIFFMISFFLGTRKGETYGFDWNNWSNETLKIEKSIDQKNKGQLGDIVGAPKTKNSLRVNKLPNIIEVALQEHYNRCRKIDGFSKSWYICGGTAPIRNTTIDKRNSHYARLADIKRIRIHDFRHSNASLLINNGVLPKEVARRLGDTESEIMKTYSHLYPQEEEKVIEILNNIEL